MGKKKSFGLNKNQAGLLLATSIIGGVLGITFFPNTKINVPSYKAVRVIDGDTFETEEKQWIRISGIEAPETGLCGSKQAKEELEKLILGKDLFIKVIYHDSTRLMGLAYTKDGLVAESMLKSGWAEMYLRDNVDLPELGKATQKARDNHLGLFSSLCTQKTNPQNPNCLIKANVVNNNQRIYHLPGCNSYDSVLVQLHHNDQWFCTEEEARKQGFQKALTCPK